MTKYIINDDEVYPEYSPVGVDDDTPAGVEIHDAFMERYRKAVKEWDTIQRILGKHAAKSEKQHHDWWRANHCQEQRPHDYYNGATTCNTRLVDGTCPRENDHDE